MALINAVVHVIEDNQRLGSRALGDIASALEVGKLGRLGRLRYDPPGVQVERGTHVGVWLVRRNGVTVGPATCPLLAPN